jgi:hypothetical protein
LTWAPTWTRIDSHPSLVASYTIDRGRQYELDRTDTGRATVAINDTHGILDPTNPDGPYYGKIEPLLQAIICRWNPVTDVWWSRFRGFIEDYDYVFDPSQQVNQLQLTLVDIFEILSAVEMQPGEFGDTPPTGSEGQVFFDNAGMDGRINQVLDNAGIPVDYRVIFTGNVELYETTYSPAESAMTAIQEAADGEFSGVANVYTNRIGQISAHGRLARFDPGTISSETDQWDFVTWAAGDGAAVASAPHATAQIRQFSFNRGLSKVINYASATPLNIDDADVAAQLVTDTTSIGLYGIRSWSATNLLTKHSFLDGGDALVETKRVAQYYVDNFAAPKNRVTACAFRSLPPEDDRAGYLWHMLGQIDIADAVTITVGSPGGGGFTGDEFFVEGIHEQVQPLGAAYDDVTLSLDLSPRAYFDTDPWPD